MELINMPGVGYCEFKKGESLIRQGEKIDSIYYLISGTCCRKTITEKGDEIIYGFKESKEFVCALVGVLILYGNGVSNSQFIARNKCCCYKIPKEVFLQFVADKPDILNRLLNMAMSEYRRLYLNFQARQEGKVANWLCELLLENNVRDKQGRLLVSKTFSNNAEVSRLLGVHKVTVAKILKSLKEEGIIDRNKVGIIILDKKSLETYANAEKSIKY